MKRSKERRQKTQISRKSGTFSKLGLTGIARASNFRNPEAQKRSALFSSSGGGTIDLE